MNPGNLYTEQVERTPTLREAMDAHIARVLADVRGNISQAARILGVERCTVQRWLRRQGR